MQRTENRLSDVTFEGETTPTNRNNTMDSSTAHSADDPVSSERRHSATTSFLSTVKAVQKMSRREKLRKAMSNRTVTSTATTPMTQARQSFASEREPIIGGGAPGRYTSDFPSEEMGMIDEDKQPPNDVPEGPLTTTEILKNMIFGKGLVSACLLAGPFAVCAVYQGWSATWVFWLNFLVMIPLASILGDFTEEAALHTNETIGGELCHVLYTVVCRSYGISRMTLCRPFSCLTIRIAQCHLWKCRRSCRGYTSFVGQ